MEKFKYNNKLYTRLRKGLQWIGEDGNKYDFSTGKPIQTTKKVQDYTSGIRGIVNTLLPDLLKLSLTRTVPILDSYIDLHGTPSKDKRTAMQRNKDRVHDMDSLNPITRAKYTLFEDTKEGVGKGLERTVLPAVGVASLPTMFYNIPNFLMGSSALIGGGIGSHIGEKTAPKIVSEYTNDDAIINNSKSLGSTTGGFIGGLLGSGIMGGLMSRARGAIANNVTPQGYENEKSYGFQTKSKVDELKDAVKQFFSPTLRMINGETAWQKRSNSTNLTLGLREMRWYRNIAWKKALKQPLYGDERNIYISKEKKPSWYDRFWNQYSRKKSVSDFDSSIKEEYNLNTPQINASKLRQSYDDKDTWWDILSRGSNRTNVMFDYITTNGGHIGYKMNPDTSYHIFDIWDILPFKDPYINFPFKKQINTVLDSKYVPKFIKEPIKNFEVVSQLGGRPIILDLTIYDH